MSFAADAEKESLNTKVDPETKSSVAALAVTKDSLSWLIRNILQTMVSLTDTGQQLQDKPYPAIYLMQIPLATNSARKL